MGQSSGHSWFLKCLCFQENLNILDIDIKIIRKPLQKYCIESVPLKNYPGGLLEVSGELLAGEGRCIQERVHGS